MRGNELLDKMELVDSAFVEEADKKPTNKRHSWMRWAAVAACLCFLIASAVQLSSPNGNRAVLEWSEGFQPNNYFKYNQGGEDAAASESIADSAVAYAASRFFSDNRNQMEADGVIPALAEHPLFTCVAHYNEDNSIYSVTFSWHQRGKMYSDLSITAGYQEIPQIQDCIAVEVDENGEVIPPAVTVTERDSVEIVARGVKSSDKTLTFQNDTAWYQISGSWADSYEAMAELLDWVWEHPIDFGLFTMEQGVEYTDTCLEEHPNAFQNCIPDFSAIGYFLGENYLQLKDGTPCRFEGHYYTGVDQSKVDDGSYLSEAGWTEIHWCIDTDPDYYDLQDCQGDISGLTERQVTDVLSKNSNISFLIDGCFIKVYCSDSNAVWTAIASLAE